MGGSARLVVNSVVSLLIIWTLAGIVRAVTLRQKEVVCECKWKYCNTIERLPNEKCRHIPDQSEQRRSRPVPTLKTTRQNKRKRLMIKWKDHDRTFRSKKNSLFLKLTSNKDRDVIACYLVKTSKKNKKKRRGKTRRIRCYGIDDHTGVTTSLWYSLIKRPRAEPNDHQEMPSLIQTTTATTMITTTTPIEHDTTCTNWQPREFYVKVTDSNRNKTVEIFWQPLFQMSHLLVGIVHDQSQERFVDVITVKEKWRLTSWKFLNANVKQGDSYRAYIRPSGCIDCNDYSDYGESCLSDYTLSDSFQIPYDVTTRGTTKGPIVIHNPPMTVGPTVSRMSESNDSYLFIILGVLLTAILFLFAVGGYCLYRAQCLPCGKKSNVKEAPIDRTEQSTQFEVERPINTVFLIYSPDNEHHIKAVTSFARLLEGLGKQVVLDRDPKNFNDVRENVPSWTHRKLKESDCALIIHSEALKKLSNAYERGDRGPFNKSNDCFTEIGPYALQVLKDQTLFHQKLVFHVNFGYNVNDLHEQFSNCTLYNITSKPKKRESGRKRGLALHGLFFRMTSSIKTIERTVNSEEAEIFLDHVITVERHIKSNPNSYSKTFG